MSEVFLSYSLILLTTCLYKGLFIHTCVFHILSWPWFKQFAFDKIPLSLLLVNKSYCKRRLYFMSSSGILSLIIAFLTNCYEPQKGVSFFGSEVHKISSCVHTLSTLRSSVGIIIYFLNDDSYVAAFLINQNVQFSFKAFTSICHTVTLISSCLLYTVLSCVFTSDQLYYEK